MSEDRMTYLGDGLYASYEGEQLVLRTDRVTEEHWVALDPEVLEGLFIFLTRELGAEIEITRNGVKRVYQGGHRCR